MKFQAFLRVLTVGALSLLLLSLGGAAWLRAQVAAALPGDSSGLTSSPWPRSATGTAFDAAGESRPARDQPKTMAFIPGRTLALGSLLVDATDWEAAQIAAVPFTQQRSLRRRLGGLKRQLRRFGIRYNQDIRPWIGSEVTAALVSLDEDRNAENGSQPGYLVAIATDDPQSSREFLQRLWRGRTAQTTRQAGIEITYAGTAEKADPAPAALATAHIGRQLVLIASHLSVLQDAISSAQSPSLRVQSRQRYSAAIAQLPPEGIGFVLADLPQLRSWSPALSDLIRLRITDSDWARHDTLLAAVTQADNDLALQLWLTSLEARSLGTQPPATSESSPSNDPDEAPPAPVDRALAAWLPSSSAAAILDRDLSVRWSDLIAGDPSPAAAAALEAIAPLDLEALGLDIQDIRDRVVPWVRDSYGIAKLPRPDAKRDWLFVTPTSPKAEDGLRDLDAQAQAQGLTVGTIPYRQHPLTVWTKLSVGVPPNEADGDIPRLIAEVKGAHAVVDNTVLVATSVGAIARALQTTETDGISRAIAALGPSPNGYLHLDWSTVRTLAQPSRPTKGFDLFEGLDGIVESTTLTRYGDGEASGSNGDVTGRASGERLGVFINMKG